MKTAKTPKNLSASVAGQDFPKNSFASKTLSNTASPPSYPSTQFNSNTGDAKCAKHLAVS